ncbi:ferredoxin-thioredoxin reductase catalytic domain-containing protein [Chloroflexota bacterium]
MNKEELVTAWEAYTENNDFTLNPDHNLVNMVIEGLITNEKKCGLKLCPCRVRDGSRKCDMDMICPCNFKSQDIWEKEGRCWCGLFIKRK